ncbi:MAG: response regulator [Chloroflexi bacterium]|nr:response regulator [Chloroflexota bacterium]
METEKSKILIIEDDLDVADMLNAYFRVQGYEVMTSNWGEDGVRAVANARPNLVILDIRLPDIDGYEVARRLRADRKTKSIPIIFLTEKRDRADRLQGLEIGADDYITKPFDVQELRLRVRNAIRRASQDSLTNPVTGLPDGEIVLEYVSDCLKKDTWSLLMVSLQNMDVFREKYGFVASDDVVRAVSLMVSNTLRESGSRVIFIGHLSLTDLLLSADSGIIHSLEERVITRLAQALDYFYPIADRSRLSEQANRLVVCTACLASDDGKFGSVEEVKAELLHRKK